MSERRAGAWLRRDDTGSVSVFVAISMMGLLVLTGLAVDGGAKIRAAQRADTIASEAARAAGQQVALADVVGHQRVAVDRDAAVRAASAYLTETGVIGTVAIGDDGSTVDVTVTVTTPTVFLSLVGISAMTVTGQSEAALIHQVTGGTP